MKLKPKSAEECAAAKARVHARVEHVFARQQKRQMGLFICTIGIKRAGAKIPLVNYA